MRPIPAWQFDLHSDRTSAQWCEQRQPYSRRPSRAVWQAKPLSERELELAMRQMDGDGDGRVDFEELFVWWQRQQG